MEKDNPRYDGCHSNWLDQLSNRTTALNDVTSSILHYFSISSNASNCLCSSECNRVSEIRFTLNFRNYHDSFVIWFAHVGKSRDFGDAMQHSVMVQRDLFFYKTFHHSPADVSNLSVN